MAFRAFIAAILISTSAHAVAGAPLRLWPDCSGSMSETAMDKLLPVLIRGIEISEDIDSVEVVRFSCKDSRVKTEIPVVYSLGAKPKRVEGSASTGLATLFASAVQAELLASKTSHETQLGVWRKSRQLVLEKLLVDLKGMRHDPAECTRFDQLSTRVAEEDPGVSIVISDGWVDCAQAPPPMPKMKGKVLVVLLPRSRDPVGEAISLFEQRKTAMEGFFPGATIVRSYLIERALNQAVR